MDMSSLLNAEQCREDWQSSWSHRGFVQPQDENEPDLWPGSRKAWKESKFIMRERYSPFTTRPDTRMWVSRQILMCDVEKCILSGQYVLISLSSLWNLGYSCLKDFVMKAAHYAILQHVVQQMAQLCNTSRYTLCKVWIGFRETNAWIVTLAAGKMGLLEIAKDWGTLGASVG